MSKQDIPSKTIEITINEVSYKIKFPTNGQFIDIERMKIDMTNGNHRSMMFGTPSNNMAYELSEVIATFTILIPGLAKDLDVKSLLELDPYQTKSLIRAYEDVYYPWMDRWMKVINEPIDKEDKEEKQEEVEQEE